MVLSGAFICPGFIVMNICIEDSLAHVLAGGITSESDIGRAWQSMTNNIKNPAFED